MRTGILRVFLNVNLRAGHDGLTKLAKDHQVKTSDLEPGSYIVFINAAKNKLKLYAANEVIAYLRLGKGRSIDMNTIRELPYVFNGKFINYDAALKTAVEKQMVNKNKSIRVI